MTVESVSLQPAFVLRRQAYRETGLILDVLTRDYGRVPLVAKGVRKAKSKTAALLQPFVPLVLSYWGKSGLKTLVAAETSAATIHLPGLAVYCGYYVNELLGSFLHQHDPHPEVFADYHHCLRRLSGGAELELALRRFELALVKSAGYGLDLQADSHGQALQADRRYRFVSDEGLVADPQGAYTGEALLAIDHNEFHHPTVLNEAKRLMRTVIDSHLQGKPLKSRQVIQQVIKHYERA